ncbi:GbsR/MarR family transcriptional regulator [Lederbergia lenta]|uniref:HTH-type transcriptional regulator n=1 Tax=Lederbergia lenta TaxID=1467 RepID=A0A2X4W7D5_LEDLE|nr:transcriptional regulator [Lederbergia lenta]MCM3110622.1 GbsR/MarR family transcriptional regulator [Lederbergia lenta]MEC2325916.1 GbsR/MarR family transcriptional regulator [Lederbergia lenta]SQI53540.1 transcriptional regulator [Lederbergia lenta]
MEGKERLEKARERIVETIAQNIHLYGATSSAGRLYGMMFFHQEPLTLDDMKEELGMSKTSMSTTVRALSDLKMVERVWKKGVRKDLYQIEDDWYQSFIDLFSTKWKSAISMHILAIKKSMTELEQLIGDSNISLEVRTMAKEDMEKLIYMAEYYEWLNRLVDAFEDHEIFKLIPKKTDQ